MTTTAWNGPLVQFGITVTSSGAQVESNPDRGPAIIDLAAGTADPRGQFCYRSGFGGTYGWAGLFGGPVIDQVPSAVSSNGIAPTQQPSASTALTLCTSANSNNVTTVSLKAPETGQNISILAIDGLHGGAAFGQTGSINLWDPTTAISRVLTILTSSGPGDSGSWSVAGRDLYGFKMTEAIPVSTASSGVTPAVGKKAWKYISSIVAPATITSTGVIVGVTDTYGFPLRVDNWAYANMTWWGLSSLATTATSSSALFTAAVTATATSTTGDVRGTFSSTGFEGGTSSAGTNRMIQFISPSVANLATVTSTNTSGLVGVAQFSSV